MKENIIEKAIKKEKGKNPIERWSEEEISPLIGNLMLLKDTNNLKENPEEYKKRTIETIHEIGELAKSNGGLYHENVSEIYNKYDSTDPVVVRREDPVRLSKLINGEDLKIYFDPEVLYENGDKYANCAVWPDGPAEKTNGIANAFLEGRGNAGPIVLLAGYSQGGKNIEVVKPTENESKVGTLDRDSVRIISGEINNDDLEFVIMRVAAKFFNESEMTEKELERFKRGEQAQIFRGFYFLDKEKGQTL